MDKLPTLTILTTWQWGTNQCWRHSQVTSLYTTYFYCKTEL